MKPEDVEDRLAKIFLETALKNGRLVEAGWSSVKGGLLHHINFNKDELECIRDFYFLGASHVVSVIGILIEGKSIEEATHVGRTIEKELEVFVDNFNKRIGKNGKAS